MKMLIESNLNKLIGLSLNSAGRAANLVWFGFGEFVTIKNRKGIERNVPKYLLHVQCSWRIIKHLEILIASRDIYLPNSHGDSIEEEFRWDIIGSTRFDERLDTINFGLNSKLYVKSLQADNVGGLKVVFSERHSLEIFPDTSIGDELWRFITYNNESSHFVITGRGIEE